MKNFFSKKSSFLLGLLAVLLAGCGYFVVNSVSFTKDTVTTFDTVELKAEFSPKGDWEQSSFNCLTAVRIPEGWEAKSVEIIYGDISLTSEKCDAYAKLLQYCYPMDGYKWVGFRTTTQISKFADAKVSFKLNANDINGTEATYDKFAIMVGATSKDLNKEILDVNKNLILEKAFGCNYDLNVDKNLPKEVKVDGTPYKVLPTTELLFNSSTITVAERNEAIKRMLTKDVLTLTYTENEGGGDVEKQISGYPYPEISDENQNGQEFDFTEQLTIKQIAQNIYRMVFESVNLGQSTIMQCESVTLSAKLATDGVNTVSDEAYGLLGIRVPADWAVESLVCKQEIDNKQIIFTESKAYTDYLEYNLPLEGYKWLGYETAKENFNLVEGNGLSIAANLLAGNEMGDYDIEAVFGYSHEDFAQTYVTKNEDNTLKTDANGAYNFQNDIAYTPNSFGLGQSLRQHLLTATLTDDEVSEANQPKIRIWDFHLANVANPKTEGMQTALAVKVTQNTGVERVSADDFEVVGDLGGIRVNVKGGAAEGAKVTVYNAQGVMTDAKVVSRGTALLKAHKGVCLVEVSKDGSKAVKKVFVK